MNTHHKTIIMREKCCRLSINTSDVDPTGYLFSLIEATEKKYWNALKNVEFWSLWIENIKYNSRFQDSFDSSIHHFMRYIMQYECSEFFQMFATELQAFQIQMSFHCYPFLEKRIPFFIRDSITCQDYMLTIYLQ